MQSMPGAVDTLKSNPSKNKLKCVSVSIIINIIENASTMKRAPPASATHRGVSLSKQRSQWLVGGGPIFIAQTKRNRIHVATVQVRPCETMNLREPNPLKCVNVKYEKSFDDYVRQCGNE